MWRLCGAVVKQEGMVDKRDRVSEIVKGTWKASNEFLVGHVMTTRVDPLDDSGLRELAAVQASCAWTAHANIRAFWQMEKIGSSPRVVVRIRIRLSGRLHKERRRATTLSNVGGR
jgi:hypothetical protein